MPIKATLTHSYLPSVSVPVGFEATFEVYDATAGGGGDVEFRTTIEIDTTNAFAWSLEAEAATGRRDNDGIWIRDTATVYHPDGIDATWQGQLPTERDNPKRFILKGRFSSVAGMVLVNAKSVQCDDPNNASELRSIAIMIPAIPAD